jgi:hypothetical protein
VENGGTKCPFLSSAKNPDEKSSCCNFELTIVLQNLYLNRQRQFVGVYVESQRSLAIKPKDSCGLVRPPALGLMTAKHPSELVTGSSDISSLGSELCLLMQAMS